MHTLAVRRQYLHMYIMKHYMHVAVNVVARDVGAVLFKCCRTLDRHRLGKCVIPGGMLKNCFKCDHN